MSRRVIVLLAILMALGLVGIASAGSPPAPPGLQIAASNETAHASLVVVGGPPGTPANVDATIVSARDEARTVTSIPAGDANLVSSTGVRLLAAAKRTTGTIYYYTWSQTINSLLWGIAWSETHKGGIYFNGNAVWVRSRLGWDTSGFHRCGYNSGIGFTVSVSSCWKIGDPSWYGATMQQGDQFKVSALYKGFPISATHEMRVCANSYGGFWGC